MNEDINNQLLVASASGDIKTVQECLKNGANLEATDAHNVTPLLYAVYNDQKEIVKILLEAGADLTATDSYNFKGYNAVRSMTNLFNFNHRFTGLQNTEKLIC